MNHITLSGELGSGKSTVANYLISKMPFRIVSAGLLFRQLAAEHGMSAKEFNEFIENDPKYDHYVDDNERPSGRVQNWDGRDEGYCRSRRAGYSAPLSWSLPPCDDIAQEVVRQDEDA